MRRVLGLLIAFALAVIGAYLFAYQLFFALAWIGLGLMSAAGLFVAGTMWLYDDLRPR